MQSTVKNNKSKLKEQFIKIGTSSLVNSVSYYFFHEVPVPKELKNMQANLLHSSKKQTN